MTPGEIHWLTPLHALLPVMLAVIALLWRGRALSLDARLLSGGLAYRHPLLALIPPAHRSPRRRLVQWMLAGWLGLMLGLAMAQPVQIGQRLPDLPPERDIVLLVDVSISMTLRDYEYQGRRISRLDVLKGLLHDFVGRLQGERLAMIVFAEDPYLLVPLTRDQTLVQRQLERLTSSMAGRVSALGDALTLALKEAARRPRRKQVFVLFTDVDESIGRVTPAAAAELAAETGIPLYAIAIGSTAGGGDNVGNGLLYQPVNVELLKTLTDRTGGATFEADDAQAIEQALAAIDRQQKNEAEQRPRYERQPLYPLFLIAGLLPVVVWQLRQLGTPRSRAGA